MNRKSKKKTNISKVETYNNRTSPSILTTIASINATILSIFFGFAVALFMYETQSINTLKNRLNELRYQASHSTSLKHESYNSGEIFVKNDTLIIPNTLAHLWYDAIKFLDYHEKRKKYRSNYTPRKHTKDEIFNTGFNYYMTFLNICDSYPYNIRISEFEASVPYDEKWFNDINHLTQKLFEFWESNNTELIDLMTKLEHQWYDDNAKDDIKYKNKQIERYISDGMSYKEALNKVENIIDSTPDSLFEFINFTNSFFLKVKQVQEIIIPQIRETQGRLKLQKANLKIIDNQNEILFISFYILIIGIILPLIIHLYFYPLKYKWVEIIILISALMPYFYLVNSFLF